MIGTFELHFLQISQIKIIINAYLTCVYASNLLASAYHIFRQFYAVQCFFAVLKWDDRNLKNVIVAVRHKKLKFQEWLTIQCLALWVKSISNIDGILAPLILVTGKFQFPLQKMSSSPPKMHKYCRIMMKFCFQIVNISSIIFRDAIKAIC